MLVWRIQSEKLPQFSFQNRKSNQAIGEFSAISRVVLQVFCRLTSPFWPPRYTEETSFCQYIAQPKIHKNTRAYNNSLCAACVKAKWTSRVPGTSTFNPVTTLHERIYQSLDTKVPPLALYLCYHSVYIHDTDYQVAGNIRTAAEPSLWFDILQHQTTRLHKRNRFIQFVLSLRNWATPVESSNNYQIVIHANEMPSREHVRRYNWP